MTFPDLNSTDIKKLLPQRDPQSHKGENGRVLIIGGSKQYFGAPILSAIATLHSGADLVHLAVPASNFEATRITAGPDFIIHQFSGDHLTPEAIPELIKLSHRKDAILIGPGLDDHADSLTAVTQIIPQLKTPIILDANAISALKYLQPEPNQQIIATPHQEEFNKISDQKIVQSTSTAEKAQIIKSVVQKLQTTILLKGPTDFIVSPDQVTINTTGNPGMTVGGSGDVLAGIVTSMISQGLNPTAACQVAAFLNGSTANVLAKKQHFTFSASQIAANIGDSISQLVRE